MAGSGESLSKKGISVPYLGKDYLLEVRKYRSYRKPGVMPEGNRMAVLTARTDPDAVAEALKGWYRQQAAVLVTERVEHYRKLLGEEVGAVRIKDVRSRWGSCSSKRNLNFNWRLVMAPLEVLDYVVVHELCHLKEMNHSPAFWKLVEDILPDYRKQREWLKTCRLIERF